MSKKQELLEKYNIAKNHAEAITLYIQMPSGETEIIINTNLAEKIKYIDSTYDDNLVHSKCNDISIKEYMFSKKHEVSNLLYIE